MSNRPLSTLSLPSSTLSALTRGGYETVQDLAASTAESLAEDLNISLPSSQAVFSATRGGRALPMTQSAASMVGATRKYSTGCGPVDRLLDGGLKRGHILEISGPPGSGKEILAANTVKSFIALGEKVIFVDMQNMVPPAALNKILQKSTSMPTDYQSFLYHLNLYTLPDLMIFLRNLPSYLTAHPTTALLVLNSLSFPFQRSVGRNDGIRHTVLERVKQTLTKACASTNLTVVITSHLATKMLKPDGSAGNFDTGSKAVMTPNLGITYLPSGKTHRVILIPQTRTTGVVRLLSSPTHVQGQHPVQEESYDTIRGMMQ
ncbi:DNA repair and recombination protein RadA [Grifola frondosa]|uniref:DNA repair and recombination protein RadA n=1 Tax=Grifola frondosa TaxID=5627 RepID=A0A1C7LTQ6_GRIFR|nr:DNA repair and recombination protein RadA [Grifola frondosa]